MPQVHISTPALTVTLNDDGSSLLDMVVLADQLWTDRAGDQPASVGPAFGYTSQVSVTPTADRNRAARWPIAGVDGHV